jgi:hypothetical protein
VIGFDLERVFESKDVALRLLLQVSALFGKGRLTVVPESCDV